MTDLSLSHPHTCPEAPTQIRTAPSLAASLVRRIFEVRRQRLHLGRLPAHLRRDIGLSDTEIAEETARPLWDAPSHWKR